LLLEGEKPIDALAGGKLVIELNGSRLKGGFALIQMKGRGEKNWLLIKKRDRHSVEDWILQRALTKEKEARLKERVPPCEAS
jgi:bifunctional non-homologous end joining protein LigD